MLFCDWLSLAYASEQTGGKLVHLMTTEMFKIMSFDEKTEYSVGTFLCSFKK